MRRRAFARVQLRRASDAPQGALTRAAAPPAAPLATVDTESGGPSIATVAPTPWGGQHSGVDLVQKFGSRAKPLLDRIDKMQQGDVRAPQHMTVLSKEQWYGISRSVRCDSLFPPSEGFAVTESFSQYSAPYPPEVQEDKERMLRRVGALSRAGPLEPWVGDDGGEPLERAMRNMTETGRRDFAGKVAMLRRGGMTVQQAVKFLQDGGAVDKRTLQIEAARAETREEMKDSPYYADAELREWGAGQPGRADADRKTAGALFDEEGLALSGAAGDRKEAARRMVSNSAACTNPLRFFMHAGSTLRSHRGRKDAAGAAAGRRPAWLRREREREAEATRQRDARKRERTDELDAEIDALMADDFDAAPVQSAPQPPAVANPPARPSRTPADLQRHVAEREAELSRRREALRHQNLLALRNGRPLSTTTAGGSHAAAATLEAYKAKMRGVHPDIDRELWPDDFWTSGLAHDRDPFSLADADIIRAVVGWRDGTLERVREAVVQFYSGGCEAATSALSALSAELAAGGGAGTADAAHPDVHPWHLHCCRLLAKVEVDTVLAELLAATRQQAASAHRKGVAEHDRAKLEKLTRSLGKRFYDLFWGVGERTSAQRQAFTQRVQESAVASAAGRPTVRHFELQSDPAVQRILKDWRDHVQETIRNARQLHHEQLYKPLDNFFGVTLGGRLHNFPRNKKHAELQSRVPGVDLQRLTSALTVYAHGVLRFAWSAMIYARFPELRTDERVEVALELRQTALQELTHGQSVAREHAVVLSSPMTHDLWVPENALREDGTKLEAAGDWAGARRWYGQAAWGLPGDVRSLAAFELRAGNPSAAELALGRVVTAVEAAAGTPVAGWPARSHLHRVHLWHRYAACLHVWVSDYLRLHPRVGRAAVLAALADARAHFRKAARVRLLQTPDVQRDRAMTMCLAATETRRVLRHGSDLSQFEWEPLRPEDSAEVRALLDAANQAAAEAELAAEGTPTAPLVDDDRWCGRGSGVKWRYVLLAAAAHERALEAARADDWTDAVEMVAEARVHEEAGCNRAYLAGAEALVRARVAVRPDWAGSDLDGVLDIAAGLAAEYVAWLTRCGSSRVLLGSRDFWVNVLACFVWCTARQGGEARQRLAKDLDELAGRQGLHMRAQDLAELRECAAFVRDYAADATAVGPEYLWRTRILFGTANRYIGRVVMTDDARQRWEQEHYPSAAATAA